MAPEMVTTHYAPSVYQLDKIDYDIKIVATDVLFC